MTAITFVVFVGLLFSNVALSVPATLSEDGGIADLVIIDNDPNARCLDGSNSGYYFRPGKDSSTKNFVISLEGGGECVGKDDCTARAQTDLGSSKHWNNTMELAQLQDKECSWNPDFCDFNQVFVKYCSGDLWSGTRATPSEESFGLIFNGHNNLIATLNHLKKHHDLDKAESVVFSGDSAGGIGMFINLDFVAQSLSPKTTVVGVPIAGFYFPTYMYTGPGHTSSSIPFSPDAWPGYVKLWQSFVPEACAKVQTAGEEWKCMMANYSYSTLKTPVYIMEAQTDSVQMSLHDDVDIHNLTSPVKQFMTEWSKNMTTALIDVAAARPDFGIFNPACLMHTSFGASHPKIQDFNYYDGIRSWMFNKGKAPRVLMDDCGIICNPICKKPKEE